MDQEPTQQNNDKNLWYHQREERDIAKRRQKMFLEGLNEQRKMERQRKQIDQKFEQMSDFKIAMANGERLAKEDEEKEGFRRRFEDASRQNDIRLNYYLNHYYVPPEEKKLRNNIASERQKKQSGRKIKVLKKRQVESSNDAPRYEDDVYQSYHPKKSRVLNREFEGNPVLYEYQ